MKDKDRRNHIVAISAGCFLFAAGFMLMLVSRIFRPFAIWYNKYIYPVWVNVIGRVTGWIPFSVSEVLLYIIIIAVLFTGLKLIIRFARGKAGKKEGISWALRVYLLAGVLFFLYAANCGINYHRQSFSEVSGIEIREYSVQELKEVCLWLTEEVNVRSEAVERDEEGVMKFPEDGSFCVNTEAVKAMQHLGRKYPELSGYYPRPKGLMNSRIMSVQNLTGIYLPFTIEANYNRDIEEYNIPFTACHELSHLRGFMQEEEANFIGFLASSGSREIHFQYSGYLLGWTYCMNALYRADYDAWEEVREQLSEDVEPDLRANREFWAKYDGKIAEVANKVNDTYLKANDQKNGVKSYNKMVDLIVTWYKRRQG